MQFAGACIAGTTLTVTLAASGLEEAALTKNEANKGLLKVIAETIQVLAAAFFVVTAAALINTKSACIAGLSMGIALIVTPFASSLIRRPWMTRINSVITTGSKILTSVVSVCFATVAAGPFGTAIATILATGHCKSNDAGEVQSL